MVGGRKAQAKQEHIVQNSTDLDFRISRTLQIIFTRPFPCKSVNIYTKVFLDMGQIFNSLQL